MTWLNGPILQIYDSLYYNIGHSKLYQCSKQLSKEIFSDKRRLANSEEAHYQWLIDSILKYVGFYVFALSSVKINGTQEIGLKTWKILVQFFPDLDKRQKTESSKLNKKNNIGNKFGRAWLLWLELLAHKTCHTMYGPNEKFYSGSTGNILKFVEYPAVFDPIMNKYLCRIKDQETMVHYQ